MENNARIRVVIDRELEELLPGFLANRRKDVLTIAAALERGDLEKVRTIGHSMKGSGGGYGMDFLSSLGMTLEEAAKKADTAGIARCRQELEDYLERVEIVYE